METRNRDRSSRWRVKLVVAVVGAALLSGCSMDRVAEVKRQTCDFETNFSFHAGDVTELRFRNPMLLRSDVTRLVGIEPTGRRDSGADSMQRYRVEKETIGGDDAECFEVELHYRDVAGEQKLSSARLPSPLGLLVDDRMLGTAAKELCELELTPLSLAGGRPIKPELVALFPVRDLLLSLLGKPTSVSDDGLGLSYRYRIVPADGGGAIEGQPVEITVWYDGEGRRPTRMVSEYRKLRTEADFLTLEARFSYGL